jgi:hypothetical protein
VRIFKKAEDTAKKTGPRRVLSRGVGAGVDQAPVSRLKKLALKLTRRRAAGKVDAGRTDTQSRVRRVGVKKPVGDKARKATSKVDAGRTDTQSRVRRVGVKKPVGDKAAPATKRIKKSQA